MTAPSTDTDMPDAAVRRSRAAAEAANWVRRLDSLHLSNAERTEFVAWLRESPTHVAEALRMIQLDGALKEYARWSELPPAASAAARLPTPLNTASLLAAVRPPDRWPRRLAGVASILTAAATIVVGGIGLQRYFAPGPHTLESTARTIRAATLSDGSVLRLAPDTRLRIDFKPKLRAVMLDRGEAKFHVAKDAHRPFVVWAGHTEVMAVGTVFSVAQSTDHIVVTVSEGHVAVLPYATSPSASVDQGDKTSIALKANESITISSAGVPGQVRALPGPNLASERNNQLFFDHDSVAEVIRRFNRHNRLQLRVGDEALATRNVTGTFDANDPRSFADFLTTIGDATRIDVGPDEILLASPHPAASGIPSPAR